MVATGNKSGGQRAVDYYEDDDYVRDTPSNSHHIKSRVFRNKNVDRSFNNETGSSRFGRSDQPCVDDTRQPSESSPGGRFGRRSQPFVESDRFSDDVVLKINSGDVGRIIGTVCVFSICGVDNVLHMQCLLASWLLQGCPNWGFLPPPIPILLIRYYLLCECTQYYILCCMYVHTQEGKGLKLKKWNRIVEPE